MERAHERVLGIHVDSMHRRNNDENAAILHTEFHNFRDTGDTQALSLKHVSFLNMFDNVDQYHTVLWYQVATDPFAYTGDPATYTDAELFFTMVPPDQYNKDTLVAAMTNFNTAYTEGNADVAVAISDSAVFDVSYTGVDPNLKFRLLARDEIPVAMQIAGVRTRLDASVQEYIGNAEANAPWNVSDSRTSLGDLLGIAHASQNSLASSRVYFAPGRVNLAGPDVVFLRTNAFASGGYAGSNESSHNWIRSIPILSNWGDVEHYLPSVEGHDTMILRTDTSLTRVDFSFEDSNGRTMTLPTNVPVNIDAVVLFG